MADITIPVSWIRKYGRDNGPEVKEILDYMLSEYKTANKDKKKYIVSGRYGTDLEAPREFKTRKKAVEYITNSVYSHLTEALSWEIDKAGIDISDKKAVLKWAEEKDYCTSYNVEGVIDTATVGNDWLEYDLTVA